MADHHADAFAPIDCAASRSFCSRTEITALRMMREPRDGHPGHRKPITCGMPRPDHRYDDIRMTEAGKLSQASTKRCTSMFELAAM